MTDLVEKLPAGFRYAGVAAGIKRSGKPDVSLIVCDHASVGAGVYTSNQIVAAPVLLCRDRTPSAKIRAVVTNSGNANACTGQQGLDDATEVCRHVARQIGCGEQDVLVMSTGVIGHMLPMDRVRAGIDTAYQKLASDAPAYLAAADAILTTDQDRKVTFREASCAGTNVRIAMMAKGAGMISPNMATLLSVALTDAAITPAQAQRLVAEAADVSFNRISVDGHTSTNDTLLLIASGRGEPLSKLGLKDFGDALKDASIELAKQIVADGEGATHVMTIHVHGAHHNAAAERIARTVAASPLVKTAITGGDPNWGRIVSAAGYSGEKIIPDQVSLKICGETIYENGAPKRYDAAVLSRRMKSETEVPIHLNVGGGPGAATFWSSDLTTEYVRFNSEYTT